MENNPDSQPTPTSEATNTEADSNNKEVSKTEQILEEESEPTPNEIELNKPIFDHPIFQFKDDELLSILLQPIEPLLLSKTLDKQILFSSCQQFYDKLLDTIFNLNPTEGTLRVKELEGLKELLLKNFPNKASCGKLIQMNEVYYRCLDCDINNHPDFHSLLCMNCFSNSNHKGHRIIRVKNTTPSSGTCDCGDKEALNSEGFCTDHQSSTIKIEELLAKFPEDILTRFKLFIKKGLYGIMSFLEIAKRSQTDLCFIVFQNMASISLNYLLDLLIFCYQKINESFLSILGLTLKETLESPFNALWHFCDDFQAEKDPKAYNTQESHNCTCSLLGCLFRIVNTVARERQSKIEKLLVECSKDFGIREYISLEFSKYIHYIYTSNYTREKYEDTYNSVLVSMQILLFQKDEILCRIIKEGHFVNYLKYVKKSIFQAERVSYELYFALVEVKNALMYFLIPKYKSAEELICRSNMMNDFIEVIMAYQAKFFYPERFYVGIYDHKVNYLTINKSLMTEKVLCLPFMHSLRVLTRTRPHEEKQSLMKTIMEQWHSNFQIAKLVVDEEFENLIFSFNPCLERIFCFMIRNYINNEISKEKAEEFLKEMLPEIGIPEISEKVSEGVLRTLGMVRYLHMIYNFKKGLLWNAYYFIFNTFFEIDVFSVQLMMLLMKPEGLFEKVKNSFFSYSSELQEAFNCPEDIIKGEHSKQKIIVIEDFLNMLIYFMNDELSLLNLQMQDSDLLYEEKSLNARQKRVLEKLIINLLLGYYWTDLSTVKTMLKGLIIQKNHLDEIFQKVTIFDENNNKVRLKDEYIKEFDPYLLYRSPSLQQDINHVVISKNLKNEELDMVGGKYHKDLPEYLKNLQKNFYQSELPHFLSFFLGKIPEEASALIRPVLKLILLNVQVVEESLLVNGKEKEALWEKVEKSYLTEEFANNLNRILLDEKLKDCHICVKKIQNLINTLSSEMNLNVSIEKSPEREDKKTEENTEETKKKLAKERMLKMKEEFAKKQAQFVDKNKDLITEQNTEESKIESPELLEKTKLTCQICLEKINENEDEYGIPIYVDFTNNFYEEGKEDVFKECDFTDLAQEAWWPVISSCNHYYHRKCSITLFKDIKPNCISYFLPPFDSCCLLCKSVCNSFLCIKGDGEHNDVSEEEKQNFQVVYFPFWFRIEGILRQFRSNIIRLQIDKPEHDFIFYMNEIFSRGYEYFIESFHLKKPKALKKSFELYTIFYRTYRKKIIEVYEETPETQRRLKYDGFLTLVKQSFEKENHELLNYKPESILSKAMMGVLFDVPSCDSDESKEEFVKSRHLEIIKEFILFKIIQVIKLNRKEESLNLDNCLETVGTLKDQIIRETIFSIQKVALSIAFNNSVLFDKKYEVPELCRLLCEDENTQEYLDNLLQISGIGLTFEQLLKISIEDIQSQNDKVNFLFPIFSSQKLDIENNYHLTQRKFLPRTITLPQNYQEFNTKYFIDRCSLCNKYSPLMLTAICLICGEIMCETTCSLNSIEKGNLNRHCRKYHMGTGLFLDIEVLGRRAINVPLNTRYTQENVYIDDMGQAIQTVLASNFKPAKLDFKAFKLNPKFVKEYHEIITNANTRKEFFRAAFKIQAKSSNGFL